MTAHEQAHYASGLLMTLDLAQGSPQLQLDSFDIRKEGIH